MTKFRDVESDILVPTDRNQSLFCFCVSRSLHGLDGNWQIYALLFNR
jgi:hypothetical protein